MRTATYAQTQSLDWGMQLSSALHVDATHVRNSWGGHGTHALICMSSHDTSAYCGQVTKEQVIEKYASCSL
jgi:hypothetical protein